MTLEDIVSKRTDLSDAATILSEITAKTIRTVVYQGLQTLDAFTAAYGKETSATLQLTINKVVAGIRATPGGGDTAEASALFIENYAQKFLITGLELDGPIVQEQLDALVPLIGQQLVTMIKELGVKFDSECSQASLADPSLGDVEDVIKTLQTKRRAGDYWSRVLAIVNPMLTTNTAEEIQSAVAGVVI